MLSINQPGVDQLVRCHSLNSLKVLDPMVIAQHAPALLALLQDPSHNVRTNVVHALRPLGARWQGEHAIKQLVLRLESDENVWARFAVLKTLSRFEPHALAPYAKEVAFSLLATGHSRPPIPAQGAFSLQLQLQGENAARGNMRMVRKEALALLRRVRDHNRRSSRLAVRDVARALLPAMREHECAEIAGEVADVVERELCAVEDLGGWD